MSIRKGLWFVLAAAGIVLVLVQQTSRPVFAQEAEASTYGEDIEVELVNVEVRVLDKEGQPVTGLTREDFEVLHDGESVPISNFTEFRDGFAVKGGAAGESDGGVESTVAAPHHLIVYFDELHLQATHRGVLVEALEKFVSEERVPAKNVMILRQGRELHIEAPFGSTSKQLKQSLKDLGESPPGLSSEMMTRQALDDIQRTWNQSRDAQGSGETGMAQVPGDIFGEAGNSTSPRDVVNRGTSPSAGFSSSACDLFESRVEGILNGWIQERSQRISVTLTTLADTATYLAGLPGNKSLLYLSDALETMPGDSLANYADSICPGGTQNLAMNALGEQLGTAFLDLTRHAAANRVTIYSVQGGGLQVTSTGDARDSNVRAGRIGAFEASQRTGSQSGLIVLADETGGRAVLNQNDYLGAFEELGREMVSYYSLAYQPPPSGKGPQHRIDVRLADKSLEARHRRGYLEKSANQRFSESLQGALYLGLVDNPLEARLAASEFRPGSEGEVILPLRVVLPVDLVSFVLQGDELIANVLVRVLSRELKSARTGTVDRSFKVKHQAENGGEWMQLPIDLQLGPGSHLLAIGVLDQESGMTSLVSTTIDVPTP